MSGPRCKIPFVNLLNPALAWIVIGLPVGLFLLGAVLFAVRWNKLKGRSRKDPRGSGDGGHQRAPLVARSKADLNSGSNRSETVA